MDRKLQRHRADSLRQHGFFVFRKVGILKTSYIIIYLVTSDYFRIWTYRTTNYTGCYK